MSFRKITIGITVVFLLIAIAAVVWFLQSQPKPTASSEHQQPSELLLTSALRFRHLARIDMAAAIEQNVSADGRKALEELSASTWPEFTPALGWQHFFSEALLMLGATQDQTALSAFYHPWSDVFLVLHWKRDNGQWQIDDVDWVTGDWMRQVGKTPIQSQPFWLRDNVKRSGALALAVAQSTQVFEALFPANASAADWRSLLNLQPSEPGVMLNRQIASINLSGVLLNQAEFNAAGPEQAVVPEPVRAAEKQVSEALQAGRMADILAQAGKTEAVHHQALSKIDPRALQGLFPVFYVPADKARNSDYVVFLLSEYHLDFAIAVHFAAQTGQPDALELIPFAAVVEASAKAKGK